MTNRRLALSSISIRAEAAHFISNSVSASPPIGPICTATRWRRSEEWPEIKSSTSEAIPTTVRCTLCWRLWFEEDALQSVRPLVRAWHLGRHLQRAGGSRRGPGQAVHRQQLYQGLPLRRWRKTAWPRLATNAGPKAAGARPRRFLPDALW